MDAGYAVDIQTGEEKWKFKAESSRVCSSHVIVDGAVYVGNKDGLYAVH